MVDDNRLYALPDGCDPAGTVAVLHPAATADLALFTHGRAAAGETVLVAGAAGHVGSMAVAMAVAAELRLITTSSASDVELCRRRGATAALDYRSPTLADELRAAATGGVDVWLDSSGHHDLDLAVDLLAPPGRIVAMSGITARPALPLGKVYTSEGSVVGFALSNASIGDLAEAARHLHEALTAGTLPALETTTLPLTDAARDHQQVEAGTREHHVRPP